MGLGEGFVDIGGERLDCQGDVTEKEPTATASSLGGVLDASGLSRGQHARGDKPMRIAGHTSRSSFVAVPVIVYACQLLATLSFR